jgi:hypothetical protein
MFDRIMCVGDLGQLDPFTTINDAVSIPRLRSLRI